MLAPVIPLTGIMRALKQMFIKGKERSNLSYQYFKEIFEIVKQDMLEEHIELTSDDFATSAKGEAAFEKMICDVLEKI